MKKENEIKVLTETEIKQKLAGYKSHYTKKVNSAKTDKERKNLESKREEYLAERLAEIQKENRHQIMRRAGVLSWETRRANSQKRTVPSTETKQTKKPVAKTTAKRTNSKVGIRIISK